MNKSIVCFLVVFNRGMNNADRHGLIAKVVRDSGRATVQELAELTGASEMTIRRDLDTLAAQGVLERVRGGARTLLLRGEGPPFALRAHEAVEAKRRIAAEICALLVDGESVLLDSGTTCLEVARLLRERPVTVMPLSLQAIHLLAETPDHATLVVPGGQPRAAEGALTGPLTLASLAALRFDTAVIGCCGLTAADGLTAYDLDDAAVKKAGIASARRVIAAADGSKLGHTAYAHVGPAALLHTLVTDTTAAAEEVTALEAGGTVVRTV
ncbi:DeoR family transcriptional regulator OS=Streptomyces antimycoticus OX=68175 GN=fruR_1 PE=4 SV=1 [Streptomyces antimycoticus]